VVLQARAAGENLLFLVPAAGASIFFLRRRQETFCLRAAGENFWLLSKPERCRPNEKMSWSDGANDLSYNNAINMVEEGVGPASMSNRRDSASDTRKCENEIYFGTGRRREACSPVPGESIVLRRRRAIYVFLRRRQEFFWLLPVGGEFVIITTLTTPPNTNIFGTTTAKPQQQQKQEQQEQQQQ
jgi:hypothetical protein